MPYSPPTSLLTSEIGRQQIIDKDLVDVYKQEQYDAVYVRFMVQLAIGRLEGC